MSDELSGRTYLITGANVGIGRVTAEVLAGKGAHVILACRSGAKTLPVVEEIREATGNSNIEFTLLDLADFKSVRVCADEFLARGLPLHGLVNNAGVAGRIGKTKDGFELQFGVNHLGHFLFTLKLLPALLAGAPSRIVNVSSRGHYRSRGIDFDAVRKRTPNPTGVPEYNTSKLANVLFTRGLAKRLEGRGITTYALHPGVVATEIWRRLPSFVAWLPKQFMITPEQGAETTLHCLLSDEAASETGLYYDKSTARTPSALALDDALIEELWAKSLAWTEAPDVPV